MAAARRIVCAADQESNESPLKYREDILIIPRSYYTVELLNGGTLNTVVY